MFKQSLASDARIFAATKMLKTKLLQEDGYDCRSSGPHLQITELSSLFSYGSVMGSLTRALASIATAILLWPLIPKLVAQPLPARLESLNAELKANMVEQQRTADLLKESEARARTANLGLERRVADQTA
jgi:hypothetical protein